MRFKKSLLLALVVVFIMAMTLSACGNGSRTEDTSGDDVATPAATTEETTPADTEETPAPEATSEGFAADATIGVSLPWLGTQNFKEAETMFKAELEKAGYKPIVQAADNKVPQQQQQIESMIQNGASLIVVAPVDGSQLGTVLEKAQAAGIKIIAYDRLLENTKAVDAVVQFGSIKTGELQGQALLDGLAAEKGAGPYNIELFGGGPADPNAPNFFQGAMNILQPKIDDGTLVVVSGQTDFTQCATIDWDNSKAQARMDSLLAGNYADKKIDGVLSPNDGIARAIITACEQAGQDIPIVSGLDAEDESVQWVWEGKQYCTVAKPTDVLVAKTLELINTLQKGEALPAPDNTADNGVIEVSLYELPPTVVTKANEKEFFANDPDRLALLK